MTETQEMWARVFFWAIVAGEHAILLYFAWPNRRVRRLAAEMLTPPLMTIIGVLCAPVFFFRAWIAVDRFHRAIGPKVWGRKEE